MHRPTWLEVDVDAVVHNLRTVRRLVGPARKIFAVVKANGYGFGSLAMAEIFAAHGADALGLADLGDAIRLRTRGITLPILVYPNALPEMAREMIAHRLTPTLVDLDGARVFSDAVPASSAPYPVFVKVDVGLERLGVPADQAAKTIQAILELPRLRLEGVSAHLHAHGARDYIAWQFARFTTVLDALAALGVDIPVRLAASTPLVLDHPDTYLNAVDPGRLLYGVPEGTGEKFSVELRPAFGALKSRLITVKDLTPREKFAAEAPFPISPGMRLGVIPIGSSDGMLDLHAGRVLVRGRVAPIPAGPSLEHTRVDLTGIPDAAIGDEVVIIGQQGDQRITVDEVAAHHRRASVNVATVIGPRISRVYLADGAAPKVVTSE